MLRSGGGILLFLSGRNRLECADLTGRKLEELPLPGPDDPG